MIMVNKEFAHTDLNWDHKCRICGKFIKRRLVKIKETPPQLCYKCYMRKKRG